MNEIDIGENVYSAGRLLQWGLRPSARPIQEPEYRQLIARYLDHPDFRSMVKEAATGLGLAVLDVGELGIVLAPTENSAFATRPSDMLNRTRAEDRLLDGLVQVGIAATVFPRAQDIEETSVTARPPVTVEEVEERMRDLCRRLEEESRNRPDPTADEAVAGLYEAWRVYNKRSATRETPDNRQAARATRRIIEVNLEALREWGCFTCSEQAGVNRYQSTWRYQVLVKELAATTLHGKVRQLLEKVGEGDACRN